MKIAIICAGDVPSEELFQREVKEADYLIAVDGGGSVFYKYDVLPDLVVGDLDSVDEKVVQFFCDNNIEIRKFKPEKDFSDTALALEEAFSKGATDITFLGCTGGRFDHFYANVLLLEKTLLKGVQGVIKDDSNQIYLKSKPFHIYKEEKYVSFFAFKEDVTELSLHGFKYPLERFKLSHSNGLCISNEIMGEKGTVEFEKGKLIVVECSG